MIKQFLLLFLLVGSFAISLEAEKTTQGKRHKPHRETNSTAETALAKLMRGNQRFAAHRMQHPHETLQRQLTLAKKGQHPFAIVLSCSDSRVPPEIIFDEGLGDLFVIRVAGNIVDDAVIGSIEYAAEHLGVRLLMVLGHEKCGAVQAAIEDSHEAHIANLAQAIRPALALVQHEGSSVNREKYAGQVARANVHHVVSQLKSSQPVLATLCNEQKLKIVGGYYQLLTGHVKLLQ